MSASDRPAAAVLPAQPPATPTAAPAAVGERSASARVWPLPALLLGVVAGTAVQLQQPQLFGGAAYAAALAVALVAGAGVWLRRRRAPALAMQGALLLASAVLVWALCGLRALAFTAQALPAELEGQDLQVTGVVAAMVQARDDGVRFRLAVQSARLDERDVRVPPLVDLGWYAQGRGDAVQPPPALRPGQRWQLTARLKAPHGALNPQGFDYELWLWEQGVQATGYVRQASAAAPPRLLEQGWQYPVEQLRQHVRDAILAGLPASGSADDVRQRAAGVVAALVTGDQRAIERGDWDVFRATGVAHLMSISGLHITMFAWLAVAVVGALWRRSRRLCLWLPAPTAALAGGVLLAGAYALFSGWGVPAQRTVCMLAVVSLLRIAGLRWPWPQVWLLACAAVLLVDPWALLQPGFWLSFVAVGVLFATDARGADAPRAWHWRLLALLREQATITLALAPLTLLLFGQVSVVGLVANLLAIPWVTLVVTPLAFAGVVWAPLWAAAAWCVQLLLVVLQWLASWPGAQLHLALAPLVLGMAAVAGALLLVARLPWGWRALGLPLLLPALWWQQQRPPPGQFDLMALDVGQGQAVLVRTAGHSLMYDAGPRFGASSDAGQQLLVPLLRAQGERLDLLVLSHGDADHTGGAAAVLAQQPQARALGTLAPDHPVQQLRAVQPCVAGQRWHWDGVRFDVLHPPAPLADAPPVRSTNAGSCVLRITAVDIDGQPGRAALLTGDIERAQEQALVDGGVPLAVDLLLVPHHGSKTSSSAAFLNAARPAVALVQAGYRNRFGHPAPAVVQRYRERGIALVATPGCGAAQWSSASGALRCTRAQRRRYWHHRLDE